MILIIVYLQLKVLLVNHYLQQYQYQYLMLIVQRQIIHQDLMLKHQLHIILLVYVVKVKVVRLVWQK